MDYSAFLKRKAAIDVPTGFEPRGIELKRQPFAFQTDVINWAVRRGRAALFEDCGLGKTVQQLAWAAEVSVNGPVLILAPLAVAPQTVREGAIIGVDVRQVSTQEEVEHFYKDGCRIFITNYDKLHKFKPEYFVAVVLDESSILKSYDGPTRKFITESFKRTQYKLACTATPAPNDYMELGNHAEFLGVMTREEMLAMFFTHDGGETSKWRLKGHAQSEFWRWLCSWAVNLRKPSDLGYDDGDFKLPPLHLHEHIVESNQKMDGYLFAMPAHGLSEMREASRASLPTRVAKAAEIANSTNEQFIVWCNLNDESKSLAKAIGGAVEVTGSDSDTRKTQCVTGFLDGTFRVMVSKASIIGYGLNLQCCRNELFVGLNHSYEQFYQAVRRCWRFGQKNPVNAHLVLSNLEGAVLANLKRKEADAAEMAEQMVKHMAEISSKEIRGVRRDQTHYNPKKKMSLPEWMAA
jgi:superfamily II DNA or RNA helicase